MRPAAPAGHGSLSAHGIDDKLLEAAVDEIAEARAGLIARRAVLGERDGVLAPWGRGGIVAALREAVVDRRLPFGRAHAAILHAARHNASVRTPRGILTMPGRAWGEAPVTTADRSVAEALEVPTETDEAPAAAGAAAEAAESAPERHGETPAGDAAGGGTPEAGTGRTDAHSAARAALDGVRQRQAEAVESERRESERHLTAAQRRALKRKREAAA